MTNQDQELTHLQELRAQHRSNIRKLEKQLAIYTAGEEPVHLLNALEHEQQQLLQVVAQLEALTAQAMPERPRGPLPPIFPLPTPATPTSPAANTSSPASAPPSPPASPPPSPRPSPAWAASAKPNWPSNTPVSMLTGGWDVQNVFQVVPHEERAFNSKLLIAQVLGRGLRVSDAYKGERPVVTVFNHDAWSSRIKN